MMRISRRDGWLYYLTGIIVSLLLISGLIYILTGDIEKAEPEEPGQKSDGMEAEKGRRKKYDKIRVVIMTGGFEHIVHNQAEFEAENGLVITYGDETKEYAGGETFRMEPDSEMFQDGTVIISAKEANDKITISSLKRGYGEPYYRGTLELYTTAEGIVIVNELPLEEYLYAVVPSEMPASYEQEALKVQAVCARSYAYCQMEDLGYPEYDAHVDDSVSYQVYGNSEENETTVAAVDDTKGEKLVYNGNVVKAYYFSTSCGTTTGIDAWGTEESEDNAYLQSVEVSSEDGYYEEDLAWFQWEAVIPEKTMSNLVGLNAGKDIGTLVSLEVTERGSGGIALKVTAKGTKGRVTVETENKIRTFLGGSGYRITKTDNTVVDSGKLLPSAFITITKKDGNYMIRGGGYGHGIGMSQNGANEMAKQGMKYEEILKLFYQEVEIAAQ